MRIGELAKSLGVKMRDVRYILEKGDLPEGIPTKPGKGEHRNLGFKEQLWLAIALKLKSVGLNSSEAKEIAGKCVHLVRNLSVYEWGNRGNDSIETANELIYLEIGDNQYYRIIRENANPNSRFDSMPWTEVRPESDEHLRVHLAPKITIQPLISIRIDVLQLFRMLKQL